MSLPVRYSPSGAVIATFDSGARLRLTESSLVMGGSLAIPAVADVIGPDGFGDADALVLTLDKPKTLSKYRANLMLDIANSATNVGAQVVLYLDTSVDGGTTWTNRAKAMHKIDALNEAGGVTLEVRPASVFLNLIEGGSLGVDDSAPTPTASLKIRARANAPVGTIGQVFVDSLATSGGTPVTGCQGTIHMELEECLGD